MIKHFFVVVLVLLLLLGFAGLLSSIFAGELLVNVNTATVEELQEVKGIGPVLSGRIVDGRPFAAVDSLINVRGIGPKTLLKFKPFVTVSDTTHIHFDEE